MPSRRAVLATCGSVLFAGCSSLREDPSVTGGWPQLGYDSARTGRRSGVDGPGPPLTTAWTYDENASNYGVDSSPVLADGRAYIAYTANRSDERAAVIDAVDAETGTREWSTTVTTTSESIHETHAYGDSLTIVDDAVLLQTANGLFALETDGTERWRFDNVGDGQLGSRPVHPGVGDGTVYTGHYRHDRESEPVIYALETAEGGERWRYEIDDWDERLVYPPAVHDGVVYAVVSGGGVKALEASDGTELWSERFLAYGNPTVSGGSVFVGTDEDASGITALAVDTGEARWSRADGPNATVPTGIAATDGTIYYTAGDRLVARDADAGDRVWSLDDERPSSDEFRYYRGTPAIVGDRLYATGSSLFVVDRSAGELLAHEPFDGWSRASPAVVDEAVYVAAGGGRLDALTECRTELFGRCLR